MKRSFLLLCTVLLVLGCALPCAAYRLARMALVVQGTAPSAAEAASVTSEESSRVAPSPADTADTVCFTDQSTGQTVQGTTLRKALGLRSACFTVVCQSGTFSFTTRGYGHGVGMSQWGAKALAEQGADYRAILAHYYPGTELRG